MLKVIRQMTTMTTTMKSNKLVLVAEAASVKCRQRFVDISIIEHVYQHKYEQKRNLSFIRKTCRQCPNLTAKTQTKTHTHTILYTCFRNVLLIRTNKINNNNNNNKIWNT